jgi:hypothetical protein
MSCAAVLKMAGRDAALQNKARLALKRKRKRHPCSVNSPYQSTLETAAGHNASSQDE